MSPSGALDEMFIPSVEQVEDIEFVGRVRARNHLSLMLAVCFTASLADVTPVLAQASPSRDTPIFLLGFEGQYGAPQRTGAGVELFLPVQKWHCGDGLCGGHGVEVQASTAMG